MKKIIIGLLIALGIIVIGMLLYHLILSIVCYAIISIMILAI